MIKLFTDTSANLPYALIEKHGITVVPFSYTVDGEEIPYDSKSDFDGKAFYDAMRSGKDVKTSMINMDTFLRSFEESLALGDDVIYIGMSGGISGTANSAMAAANELQGKYPDANIASIDTYAASLGEGLLVLEAADMIASGADFAGIVRSILERRNTMCQYFTVDDLEYLKKGGRISGAAALIGSILSVKPLLKGDSTGHIVLCGKSIGSRKALNAISEKYDRLSADRGARIGIAHADNEAGAEYVLNKLRSYGFSGECITVCYEPVTGSHVGPGTVALFFPGTEK